VRGHFSQREADDPERQVTLLQHELQVLESHLQTVSRDVERLGLDIRSATLAAVKEKHYEGQLGALKGKLMLSDQVIEDVTRQLQTEQLRTSMLTEAFQTELNRVDASVNRAKEAHQTLEEANRATRDVEEKEQFKCLEISAEREALASKREIEEHRVGERLQQLRSELQSLVSPSDPVMMPRVPQDLTAEHLETVVQTLRNQVDGIRRRQQEATAEYNQHQSQLGMALREFEGMSSRAIDVAYTFCSVEDPPPLDGVVSSGHMDSHSEHLLRCLSARLRVNQETCEALNSAIARSTAELQELTGCRPLDDAVPGSPTVWDAVKSDDWGLNSSLLRKADAYVTDLARELEQLQSELNSLVMASSHNDRMVPLASSSSSRSRLLGGDAEVPEASAENRGRSRTHSSSAAPVDLEAAALQRRFVEQLVSETTTKCRLQEERAKQQSLSSANSLMQARARRLARGDPSAQGGLGASEADSWSLQDLNTHLALMREATERLQSRLQDDDPFDNGLPTWEVRPEHTL